MTVQTGQLGSIAAAVADLIASPPAGVDDLPAVLGALPLPDLAPGTQLAQLLGEVRAAVPADLSALTGPLDSRLAELQARVGTDLTGALTDALELVRSVQRLAAADFRCLALAGGNGGVPAGGGGPPAGGEGGEGAPAGATATAAAAATASSQRLDEVLDRLPTPLTVPGFLGWVATLLDLPDRDTLLPHVVPLLDGFRDPLLTLVRWEAMSGEEIRADFAATLGATATLVGGIRGGGLEALAADAAAALPAEALAQVSAGLVARFDELAAAVDAGDLSGAGPAIAAVGALLDGYDALRAGFDAEALAGIAERARELGGALEDRMTIALGALAGAQAPPGLPEALAALLADSADASAVTALEAELSPYFAWLQDLAAKLDLSALEQPVADAAAGARAAADAVNAALVAVAVETQALFGQLDTALDGVDVDAVRAGVEQAIAEARDELFAMLTGVLAGAREAVEGAVGSIEDAVDGFDPAAIVDALEDVLEAVADVLGEPEVAAAIGRISDTVEAASRELGSLSFAPVVDGVVAAIDEVAEILRRTDTSVLGVPAQLALQAALALIPEDLTPVTDPLVEDLGAMIASGPLPLVTSVRSQPERLLDSVRRFEPVTLVGALSQPFEALLAELSGFAPSTLLAPVAQELDALRERLRAEARPGRALEPLEPIFDDLLATYDGLRPEALVAPLQAAVTGAVDGVLAALPVDEAFEAVDAALAEVRNAAAIGTSAQASLRRLRETLEAFADPEQQLEQWVDEILAGVGPLGDDGSLAAALAQLDAAVADVRAGALAQAYGAVVDPLLAGLDELDPPQRLTDVVQAHLRVDRDALAALPDSPQRAALAAALDRADPLAPAFAAPYRALALWRDGLAEGKDALAAALADWDERYHPDGGTLAALAAAGPAPGELAARVREHLAERFVQPLAAAFGAAAPLAASLAALGRQLEHLLDDLQGRLPAILDGPDSLTAIRDSVHELVERLRALDVEFLTESLDEVFGTVRGKIEAVDPAPLRLALDSAFEDMLATLTLDEIIPPATVAALDTAYADVVAKLRQLDPGTLVTEVVQPQYEVAVTPLLAPFDLTPVLDALVARLDGIEAELRAELARVNEAWRRLRAAVPTISPLDLSLDVDIGLESPF